MKCHTPVEGHVWHHNGQVVHYCSGLPYTFHKPSVLHRSTSTVHLSSVTDAMAQELWPTLVGNVSNTVLFKEMTAVHSHLSVVGHSLWYQSSPEADATRRHPLASQDTRLASSGKHTFSGLGAHCTSAVSLTPLPQSSSLVV